MRPPFIPLAILLIMAVAIGICSYLGIVVVLKMIRPLLSSASSSTWKLTPHYYPFMPNEEEEAMILEMSETAEPNAPREETTPPPTTTLSPCQEYERAIAIAKKDEEDEAFETELLVDIFGERARRPPSPTTTPSYSPCEEYLRSIEEEKAIAEAKAQEEREAKAIAEAIAIAKEKEEADAFELELLNDIFSVKEERLPPPSIRPWDLHEWIRFNANAGEPDKD